MIVLQYVRLADARYGYWHPRQETISNQAYKPHHDFGSHDLMEELHARDLLGRVVTAQLIAGGRVRANWITLPYHLLCKLRVEPLDAPPEIFTVDVDPHDSATGMLIRALEQIGWRRPLAHAELRYTRVLATEHDLPEFQNHKEVR